MAATGTQATLALEPHCLKHEHEYSSGAHALFLELRPLPPVVYTACPIKYSFIFERERTFNYLKISLYTSLTVDSVWQFSEKQNTQLYLLTSNGANKQCT